MRRLADALGVQPGEGRLTTLLLLHSVLNGVGKTFVNTAAFALFLAHYDAALMPYAYIAAAVLGPVSGLLYGKVQERVTFRALMLGTLVVLTASLAVFRVALFDPAVAWPVAAFLVWNELFHTFLELEFWGVAERSYNVRQAKRLFGLVGSGEVAAGIAGGFAVPLLVQRTGTASLLLLSAVGLGGSCLLLLAILRRYGAQMEAHEGEEEDAGEAEQHASKLAQRRLLARYVRWIIALAMLATLAYYVVDTAYFAEVEHHFPDADRMAGFIGVFDAGAAILTFVFRLAVAGRLMSRFGVTFSLMALPALLLAGTGALSVVGTAAGAGLAAFVLISASKMVLEVLGEAVDRPAMLTLYQPLPAQLRLRAMNLVESFAFPIGQGLSGALILGYGLITPVNAVSLSYLAVVLLVVAVLVRPNVGRTYVMVLGSALARRALGRSSLAFADHALLDALRQGLSSPDPRQALYCLNRLEEHRDERLDIVLMALLRHPAPEIRGEAARRIERRHTQDAYGAVVRQLLAEPDTAVRAALLRTAVSLEPSEARQRVRPYLDLAAPEDRPMRLAALAALLCYAIGPARDDAVRRLLALASSSRPEERRFAAELAGRVLPLDAIQVLPVLLADPEDGVRLAALEAATHVSLSTLWRPMIANLAPPGTRLAALAAITASGPAMLPAIAQALSDPGLLPVVRQLLLRALGRIGGDQATAMLWRHAGDGNSRVRAQALRSLALLEYRAPEAEDAVISGLLAMEARVVALVSAVLAALPADGVAEAGEDSISIEAGQQARHEALALAHRAAEDELRESRERVFLIAGLRYDRRALADALASADSESGERRATAVELLDNLVAPLHKPYVLPLIDDLAPAERALRLRKVAGDDGAAPEPAGAAALMAVVAHEQSIEPWTRLCARYAAAVLGGQGADLMTRDAAAAAPIPGASGGTDHSAVREEMLTTLERVLLLRRVGLFQRTPDASLADVAEAMTEVELLAGETLMREGERAESLYVIAEGTVDLLQGGRHVATLGEGDVAGELEALDPQPRAYTARAATDTRLLALRRDLLFELMGERLEVAHGIVEYLIRRYAHAPGAARDTAPAASDALAAQHAVVAAAGVASR